MRAVRHNHHLLPTVLRDRPEYEPQGEHMRSTITASIGWQLVLMLYELAAGQCRPVSVAAAQERPSSGTERARQIL